MGIQLYGKLNSKVASWQNSLLESFVTNEKEKKRIKTIIIIIIIIIMIIISHLSMQPFSDFLTFSKLQFFTKRSRAKTVKRSFWNHEVTVGEKMFLHRVQDKLPFFSFTATKKNIIDLTKRKHYSIHFHYGNLLNLAIKVLLFPRDWFRIQFKDKRKLWIKKKLFRMEASCTMILLFPFLSIVYSQKVSFS